MRAVRHHSGAGDGPSGMSVDGRTLKVALSIGISRHRPQRLRVRVEI